jgi:hypothetical protein
MTLMFYLIYKITNTANGKIYIGSHKTKNQNDGYMGSGKYLNRAIAKSGIENFTKEILFVFDNPAEMYAKEAEIVNEDFLVEENTYNLKLGGFGGFDFINLHKLNGFSNKDVAKAGRAATNKILEERYGQDWRTIISKEGAAKSKEAIKEKIRLDPVFKQQLKARAAIASNCALSNEAREKRKQSFKENAHQVGEKNSQFGKMWITNGTDSMPVLKSNPLPNGWRKGRVMPKSK